jgi:CHAT domain
VRFPLEELAARVASGEVSLPVARELAAQPPIAGTLDLAAVTHAAARLDQLAAPTAALDFGELLVTAAAAMPATAATGQAQDLADVAWVHKVTAALPALPDWRRYQLARAAGDRLLARAQAADDATRAARAHLALARLHLQPLLAPVTGDDAAWLAVLDAWYRRGREAAAEVPPYPPPAESLRSAGHHFAQAAALSAARERGRALVGQVNALERGARAAGTPPPAQLAAVIREALPLLDPDTDADSDAADVTYLLALAQQQGQALDRALLERAARVPLAALVKRIGAGDAAQSLLNLSHALRPIDPRLSLATVQRAAPAVAAAADANLFARYNNALITAWLPTFYDGPVDNAPGTLAAASLLNQQAQAAGWSPERCAGALLALVRDCPARDEEAEGLQLLDVVEQALPALLAQVPEAIRFWRLSLWSGAGVNAARAGRIGQALAAYHQALRGALALGLDDFLYEHLRYVAGLGLHADAALLLPFLGVVFDLDLQLDQALGARALELLQVLLNALTERQMSGAVNTNLLHLTWQAAKARRFSAALRLDPARRQTAATPDQGLLSQIAALRESVPLAGEGTGPGSRIDTEIRLLAFTRADSPAPGRTPLERLTNLQHSCDDRLERQLAGAGQTEAQPSSLEELRGGLDPRTALLQLFLGEWQGKRAIYALLAARDGEWLSAVPGDLDLLCDLKEGDRVERASTFVADVFRLRQAILDDTLDPAALRREQTLAGSLFLHGSVRTALDQLRRHGCDHLVVVPHGPFHYAPLHLLGLDDDRLLGDEWTVTVVPSIELLQPPAAASPAHRQGIAAFGLTFQHSNPYQLDPLPDVATEATLVAQAFASQPILDDAVTHAAVLDGLRQARCVHLATHGALNLDAPAFQYLVLTPAPGASGLLHAHELLRQDLRGLQLVTLSACETALGRFDRADNPRGLPAALLLAGAETLVGTLWETASDVACAFFVELYQALAQQATRRDAFRQAQLEIRRRYPHPSDWGAFYLLGAWS